MRQPVMKLKVLYKYSFVTVSILIVLSRPVVAQRAPLVTDVPLRKTPCNWLLQPLIKLQGKFFNSKLWTYYRGKEHEREEASSLEPKRGYSLLDTAYNEQLVLRFNLSGAQDGIYLAKAASDYYLDLWEFNKYWVDVRVRADAVEDLLSTLPIPLRASSHVLMDGPDLLNATNATYPPGFMPGSAQYSGENYKPFIGDAVNTDDSVFFQDYRPLSAISSWMLHTCSRFPDHSKIIDIGESYEGRKIQAFRVGMHLNFLNGSSLPRKAIVVSGGMHAREWVGLSTVAYVAHSLITGYGKYRDITAMVKKFDWIFIPTLNPDGYVYTWQTDRLWRKTRQPTSLHFCQGMDLDRAFDFHWTGESANPCSENYAGQRSFESVEAHALASWAQNETSNSNVEFVGFLDMHSYSQQILYPYSYSCGDLPPTLEDLQELAQGLAKAIRLGGAVYQTAPACSGNVLSQAERMWPDEGSESGGSVLDWFYQKLGVRHAFQFKLRDNGAYGFLLSREFIIPTGKEILNAVKHFAYSLEGYDDAAKADGSNSPVGHHSSWPVSSFSKQQKQIDQST